MLNTANRNHRLAEISLGVAGGMGQRHKHLSTARAMVADIVLDHRIAPLDLVLIPQTLRNVPGGMSLLTVPVEIVMQRLNNEAGETIHLGPLDLGRSLISGRNRKAHHLLDARTGYPKMARRLTLAHTTPTRQANLQIQIHDKKSSALPAN